MGGRLVLHKVRCARDAVCRSAYSSWLLGILTGHVSCSCPISAAGYACGTIVGAAAVGAHLRLLCALPCDAAGVAISRPCRASSPPAAACGAAEGYTNTHGFRSASSGVSQAATSASTMLATAGTASFRLVVACIRVALREHVGYEIVHVVDTPRLWLHTLYVGFWRHLVASSGATVNGRMERQYC